MRYADRAERERQYSPSSMVDDLPGLLERYSRQSAEVRSHLTWETIAYGDDPDEKMDVFPAASDRAHVFVHGGYWQELSRQDSCFPAPGFVSRHTTFVAMGYPLAPRVGLESIVESVRRGISTVRQRLVPDGHLVVSGSSAGAHLAAMAALTNPVNGLVLVSGIFDLGPLVDTYVNDVLGLDADLAARLSPLHQPPPPAPAIIVAYGEHETEAFHQQSQALTLQWGLPPPIEVADRNHFDIVHDLGDPSTILGYAVAALEHDAV